MDGSNQKPIDYSQRPAGDPSVPRVGAVGPENRNPAHGHHSPIRHLSPPASPSPPLATASSTLVPAAAPVATPVGAQDQTVAALACSSSSAASALLAAALATGPALVKLGTNDDISKSLECPVCLDIAFGELFLCMNGHQVCRNCRLRIPNCGLCGTMFTIVRNLAVESIIGISQFHCPNAPLGCNWVSRGDIMLQHLNNCDFVEVICYDKHGAAACNGTRVRLNEYVNHVKTVHRYDEVFQGTFSYKSQLLLGITFGRPPVVVPTSLSGIPCTLHPLLVHFDDKKFVVLRCEAYGCYYTWIKIVGHDNDAKLYQVRLWMRSVHKKPEHRTDWQIGVHPVRTTFDQVRASGRCATIPIAGLTPFFNEPPRAHLNASAQILSWNVYFVFERRNSDNAVTEPGSSASASSGCAVLKVDPPQEITMG